MHTWRISCHQSCRPGHIVAAARLQLVMIFILRIYFTMVRTAFLPSFWWLYGASGSYARVPNRRGHKSMMQSDVCLTFDVCLSACLSRIHWAWEAYRKTKIGTEVTHVTRDSDTAFKVKTHYLSELIQIHVPHRHLRSADAERLAVPRTKLKFTNRAFSHQARTRPIWNGLAVCRSALSTVTLSQFKRLVKSELYNRAFDNIWNVTFPHLWFFYWLTLSASTTV